MNLQSIVLLAAIVCCFIAAVYYTLRHGSGCGCSGSCNGDCTHCIKKRKS